MIIKIRVLRLNNEKLVELYRNQISVSDALQFEFAKVHSVLKLLYPSSNFIEFSVS